MTEAALYVVMPLMLGAVVAKAMGTDLRRTVRRQNLRAQFASLQAGFDAFAEQVGTALVPAVARMADSLAECMTPHPHPHVFPGARPGAEGEAMSTTTSTSERQTVVLELTQPEALDLMRWLTAAVGSGVRLHQEARSSCIRIGDRLAGQIVVAASAPGATEKEAGRG